MLDALNGIVYLDDSQVVEIHAFREDDKENPRVHFYAYEREDSCSASADVDKKATTGITR